MAGAKEYRGSYDPVKAMEWVEHTESLFEVTRCWTEDKGRYAVVLFVEHARDWWKGLTWTMSENERQALTWNFVKEEFLKQYCPWDLQRKLTQEFLDLKQGDKSVNVYLGEFLSKAKFAVDYIPNERERAWRFIEGLNCEIKKYLIGQEITTIARAVDQARLQERLMKGKGVGPTSGGKKLLEHSSSSGSNNQVMKDRLGKRKAPCQTESVCCFMKCFTCNAWGHLEATCPKRASGKPLTCYECGQVGHIRRNCPRLKNDGNKK